MLVAEDNATLRTLSMRLVARLGHEVETVTTGAEAVGAVMTGHFDVVLMDIRMPVMDGLEAARRIRSAGDRDRQPRIVAITASATLRDQETYLRGGHGRLRLEALLRRRTCSGPSVPAELAIDGGAGARPPVRQPFLAPGRARRGRQAR